MIDIGDKDYRLREKFDLGLLSRNSAFLHASLQATSDSLCRKPYGAPT